MARGNGHGLLTPDDREDLDAMLENGTDTLDKRGFCLGILTELRRREADGDESAARIITAMGYDGVYRALDKLAKRPTSVFKDAATGRILNYPKAGSVDVLNENGTATGARQIKFWEDMSREEFQRWVDQQVHLAESMRFKVRGLQRVLAAWAKFPHAINAGHACVLAGIDPDEIEFVDAA